MKEPPPARDVDTAAGTQGHVALCGAECRSKDGTCRNVAGWGTDHVGVGRCRKHFGNTPNHVKRAAMQATEAEARAMLERLGEPDPLGDPVDEYLSVGAETKAFMGVLREQVAHHRHLATTDVMNVERERATVILYERALDRCAKVLSDLVRLNLEERRTRVGEIRGAKIVHALEVALADAGLDAVRRARAREVLSIELVRGDSGPSVSTSVSKGGRNGR
jgi:hypothetical protein